MYFNSVDLSQLEKNYKSNINADILHYMPHAALGEFHHVGAANRLSCATNLAREPHNISAALWQLQQQIEISAQLSCRRGRAAGAEGGAGGGSASRGKSEKCEMATTFNCLGQIACQAGIRCHKLTGPSRLQAEGSQFQLLLPAPAPAAAPPALVPLPGSRFRASIHCVSLH